MKIFIFHDADPYGYSIANVMGKQSGAHRFNFEIIDAGLHIGEAIAMGLETEKFNRSKSLNSKIKWTKQELRYFEGREVRRIGNNGKPKRSWVDCERVELNALAANPDLFADWIETKLQDNGLTEKLVPDASTITSHTEQYFASLQAQRIHDALLDAFNIDDKVQQIVEQLPRGSFGSLPAKLATWAKSLEPKHWTDLCNEDAQKLLRLQDDRIQQLVGEVVQ